MWSFAVGSIFILVLLICTVKVMSSAKVILEQKKLFNVGFIGFCNILYLFVIYCFTLVVFMVGKSSVAVVKLYSNRIYTSRDFHLKQTFYFTSS